MTRRRAVQRIATSLDELPLKFIRCRAFGHRWDDLGVLAVTIETGQKAYERKLRCTQCGYVRYDYESRSTGRLLMRSRRQPNGYRLGFRVTQWECRQYLQQAGKSRGGEVVQLHA